MKIALSIPGFEKIDSSGGLPAGTPTGGLATGQNVIGVFIVLIVTIAILFALWSIARGGLGIIQSRGIKEKFKSGRERALYGIFGLIMIFLSFLIINAFSAFLGYDLLCILFKPLSSCK